MSSMRWNNMKKVKIYVKGTSNGHNGPGGYCAILTYGDIEKIVTGGSPKTDTTTMELCAVIKALFSLKQPCKVEIITESKYIMKFVWNDKIRKDKNEYLWDLLNNFSNIHDISFKYMNGHSFSIRCDKIAVCEVYKYSK